MISGIACPPVAGSLSLRAAAYAIARRASIVPMAVVVMLGVISQVAPMVLIRQSLTIWVARS